MSGQLISRVNAPVLTAGAAETYHQTLEATLDVIFDSEIYHIVHAVQELVHFRLLLQVIHYTFIAPVKSLKFLNAAGIQNTTAVKNKSTSMTRVITGNS